MKFPIVVLWLLIGLSANSQKIEKFLDYRDKETDISNARYYVNIQKTDSGWLRNDYFIRERKLQMQGVYVDSACKIASGQFSYFYPNGRAQSIGNYVEGKRDGLWLGFYSDGMMRDSTVYFKNHPVGTSLKWHRNGFLLDSSILGQDGSGIEVSWFDNGLPSSAGRFSKGHLQNGKWHYFHKNGKLSAEEIYDNGRLVEKKYSDDNGNLESDTTSKDRGSSFPGGQKAWAKYLEKKLYFPPQYRIKNAETVVVVIDAVVNEDGKLEDVQVTVPFEPSFDEIALKALLKSPDWIPAIHHNRKVKSYIRQPVNFGNAPD